MHRPLTSTSLTGPHLGRPCLLSFAWLLLYAPLLWGCSDEKPRVPQQNPWHSVSEGLPGALFSVDGSSAEHVWVVGADRGDGEGPTIVEYDGDWHAHASGLESGDLYWVHVFADDVVYTVGTGGTILSYTGDQFELEETPTNQDVWGLWGKTSSDIWAVGGDPNTGVGFVWRDQGEGFSVVELDSNLPRPSAWYKVWGPADDDVWFCGVDGALMHYDGQGFEAVDAATSRALLTIHGREDGSLVTAVGGQFSATLVASKDGGDFEDVTPEGPPLQTFGVFHRDAEAFAVGMQGTVLHHDGTSWAEEVTGLDIFEDLHAVWIDPDAGVWAVGGQLISPPFEQGALIYKGERAPPPIEL